MAVGEYEALKHWEKKSQKKMNFDQGSQQILFQMEGGHPEWRLFLSFHLLSISFKWKVYIKVLMDTDFLRLVLGNREAGLPKLNCIP